MPFAAYAQPVEGSSGNTDRLPWSVTFGAYLSTRGGGGQLNYIQGRNRNQLIISLDGYVISDTRETDIGSAFGEQGGEYTYGKLNYVFMLTPTAGIQRDLFPINERNLINMRLGVQVGPAIAFVIPYKLEIFNPIAGRPTLGFPSIEAYDPSIHGYEDIIRRAKLFSSEEEQGLNPETQIGVSFKTHMLFDFSKNYEYVGGIQLGFGLDYFSESLPIMAFVDNKQTYLSGTLGIIFGLRN